MFSPSHLKTLHPLQAFSLKPSSSSISSMKLKRIVHTLIVSHLCRIIRALSKVKAVVVEILKDNNSSIHKKHYYNNRRKKIILGSFRLHYNWCSSKSSHVLPVPQPVYEGLGVPLDEDCPYLRWLEAKKVEVEGEDDGDGGDSNKGANGESHEMNEIDVLAEMFIANCHEKFRLEKQESDRRFHEMLARSM
ncbi:hypothetical protein Fmac_029819 [Flemingia macrophylla]|uniref:Uncharacterized protein n=1 Tax=Flemingia macrophylla TaxID=520843 RepID=A0ABD1LBE4_9FABA